ncbi:putative transmembrane protein [Toxoplasma gondii GAB2-2007-GAL-DOM2]|uniref:Transmembrane protein n=4 Tax=Toxoplasma gondii TaxID=5811 RepID=V4Z2N1_TOXGV|nr:putative transmembrane protein [Toxoplasma gondii VEG]KFG27824.1 putative transmembrane protein [Toxoplasma gondii p89]KFG29322.1 putative transmembrane protein [Toxoplasma gondii GAB2-2007-GAL-DOM2]PUA83377.1 putative transmembrane protein [Toxoplasma gondii TgCATBr9]
MLHLGCRLGSSVGASEDKKTATTCVHKRSPMRISLRAIHKLRPHSTGLLISLYAFIALVALQSLVPGDSTATLSFGAEAMHASTGGLDTSLYVDDIEENESSASRTRSNPEDEDTNESILEGLNDGAAISKETKLHRRTSLGGTRIPSVRRNGKLGAIFFTTLVAAGAVAVALLNGEKFGSTIIGGRSLPTDARETKEPRAQRPKLKVALGLATVIAIGLLYYSNVSVAGGCGFVEAEF